MKNIIVILLSSCLVLSCEKVLFEEEPENDPIGNFESLWTTFNERYAVFEQRGVDWQVLYEQYRPQVTESTSDDELFEIITAMLSHLDDGHVSLMADGRTFWSGDQEFRERTRANLFQFAVVSNEYIEGNMTIIDNQYAYGNLPDDVGYLFVGALGGDSPLFIDDFIQSMQDKKGIIIDLRHNNGGDFTNGEVIASRFAGERKLAFSGTPKNGPGPNDFGETTDYYIEADGPLQYTKPVIVLTNCYTISAGENLVLYLRVQPNVTLMGENTTGAMGERIEKEMPNGWIYSITGQLIHAADDQSYEGPGIPPEIRVDNTSEEVDMGIDRMLETAMDALN